MKACDVAPPIEFLLAQGTAVSNRSRFSTPEAWERIMAAAIPLCRVSDYSTLSVCQDYADEPCYAGNHGAADLSGQELHIRPACFPLNTIPNR